MDSEKKDLECRRARIIGTFPTLLTTIRPRHVRFVQGLIVMTPSLFFKLLSFLSYDRRVMPDPAELSFYWVGRRKKEDEDVVLDDGLFVLQPFFLQF